MSPKFLRGMLYRDGKLALGVWHRALILILIFTALCGALAYGMTAMSESGEKPLTIAIVDKDDSIFSRMALKIVSEDDALSRIVSMVKTDEQSARSGIRENSFGAAILLPEGYLEDLSTGVPTDIKVIFAGGVTRGSDVLQCMSLIGERLIKTGQYAVFAGESAVVDNPETSRLYDDYIVGINDAILAEVMRSTSEYYTPETTSYSHSSLTLIQHTALVYIVFLIEICTLFFYRSTTADMSRGMYSRLVSLGGNAAGFIAPKVIYSFLFRLALGGVLFGGCGLIGKMELRAGGILPAVAAILFLAAEGALASVALYGNRYGIAILSGGYILSLLLCGGILPLSFLSERVAALGRMTPMGVGYSMTSTLFGADFDPLALLWGALWLAATAFLAARALESTKKEAFDI